MEKFRKYQDKIDPSIFLDNFMCKWQQRHNIFRKIEL